MPKIMGIEHIGIASKDPERTRWFFSTALKLTLHNEESVDEQGVDTISYDTAKGQPPPPRIELLIPTTKDSPVAKFLQKKGTGVHHIALRVQDIDHTVQELKNLGITFVNPTPQHGINNTRIVFIHPKSTGGILVELVEKNSA